jgi:hypothetical protein
MWKFCGGISVVVCEIVTTWPPIVIVPVRLLVVMLMATVNVTVPDPVPLAGVADSHGALVVAVHAQPEPVVTVMLPLPPFGPNDVADAASETLQLVDAAWVTVNGRPAIVAVPVREVDTVFVAAM